MVVQKCHRFIDPNKKMSNYTSTYYAIRKKHQRIFIFILVVAITMLITVFALYMTQRDHPNAEMWLLDNSWILFLGSALLGWYSYKYYLKKRFKIETVLKNNRLSVQVLDPALPMPLVVNYPFILKKQWMHVTMPKGPRMKKLYVTIIESGNVPVVTFFTDLGAMHDAPMDYEYLGLDVSEANAKLIISDKLYGVNKLIKMVQGITIDINTIESKK